MAEGKGLLAILGAPDLGGGEDEDLGGEVKLQAARDLRSALKGDDDEAIVGAFQRLYDACSEKRDSDEYED